MSCDECPYLDKFNERCMLSDEEWAFLAEDLEESFEDWNLYPCFAKKAVTE